MAPGVECGVARVVPLLMEVAQVLSRAQFPTMGSDYWDRGNGLLIGDHHGQPFQDE